MGAGPAAIIPSPLLAAPRTSLEQSAARPDRDVEGFPARWTNGVTFRPEDGCTGTVPTPVDPCGPTDGDLDLATEPGVVVWEPYVVWDGTTCTTLGRAALDEAAALAQRRLVGSRSAQMERELWEGTAAQAAGWANRYFSDGTADNLTEAGSVGLTHGLAVLQQYLGETLQGRRGMIHATRQVVTHWTTLNLLRRENGVIFDLFDNIVVPGAGYRGYGPDGEAAADGSVWAFATGVVSVLINPTVEVDTADSWSQVDRDTNDYVVRAQQIALALWDGCALGAAELDVILADVGGS